MRTSNKKSSKSIIPDPVTSQQAAEAAIRLSREDDIGWEDAAYAPEFAAGEVEASGDVDPEIPEDCCKK